MKDKKMTAVTFRIILASILGVAVLASIATTYFGQGFLRSNSESVIQAVSTEYSSKNRLEQLKQAEQVLEQHEESMDKAQRIAAPGQGFAYQQQLIDDINRYSERAGLVVSGYSFSEAPTAEAGASTEGSDSATAGAGNALAGKQKVAVSVTFQSPVRYETMVRFLTILETSLPKINAQSIQINRSEADPNSVELPSLNLEVYIQQ